MRCISDVRLVDDEYCFFKNVKFVAEIIIGCRNLTGKKVMLADLMPLLGSEILINLQLLRIERCVQGYCHLRLTILSFHGLKAFTKLSLRILSKTHLTAMSIFFSD